MLQLSQFEIRFPEESFALAGDEAAGNQSILISSKQTIWDDLQYRCAEADLKLTSLQTSSRQLQVLEHKVGCCFKIQKIWNQPPQLNIDN